MPRREAAIKGAREIGFAVVAMTLTLASVFAPLAFATGRTGRLFIEFALTLAGAVLVSGFVALTLSPMMCSLLLRHEDQHSWIYNPHRGRDRRAYAGLPPRARLRAAPPLADRHGRVGRRRGARRDVLPAAQVRARAARGPRRRVRPRHRRRRARRRSTPPTDQADRGVLRTDSRGGGVHVDRRLSDGRRRQRGAAPEAVGGAHARSSSRSPKSCGRSSRRIPGALAFPINPPSLGQSFRSTPIEFVIMSQVPYEELQRVVDRFLDEMRKYPGVQNLQTDLRLNTPEVRVDDQPRQALRRRRRRRHRRPHARDDARRPAGDALQEGRRAVRRDRAGRAGRPHDAGRHQRHATCAAATASMVQLSNLVDVREGVAPQSLNHFNRLRAVKVTGTLAPGYAIGEALKSMEMRPRARAAADRADRPRRPVARVPRVRRRDLLHVRAGADVHLPRAGGAVRELRRTRSSSCCRCRCR